MRRRIFSTLLTSVFVLAGVIPAFSQADVSSATIKGSVTDQNKAVVVGATVTAKSVERGITRTAKTDSDGAYVIPTLQPGDLRGSHRGPGLRGRRHSSRPKSQSGDRVFDVELQPAA